MRLFEIFFIPVSGDTLNRLIREADPDETIQEITNGIETIHLSSS